MDCPDCNTCMVEQMDFDKIADIIELIETCANCGTGFFGTLYRVEKYVEPDDEGPF